MDCIKVKKKYVSFYFYFLSGAKICVACVRQFVRCREEEELCHYERNMFSPLKLNPGFTS